MTVGFRVRFEFGLGRGANVRGGGANDLRWTRRVQSDECAY